MDIDVKGFDVSVKSALKTVSQALITEFGSELKSITVTGSALTDDFVLGKSMIDTVLVLEKDNIDIVGRLCGFSKLLKKHKFALPLIMTSEHIDSSKDVFGVEYLDFQLNSRTIYGSSPFSDIVVEKSDVRLQCEREFKSSLIRLRQGFIRSNAESSLLRNAMLKEILQDACASLLPHLRAMLWLCDVPREPALSLTIQSAAERFGFDGDELKGITMLKYSKKKLSTDQMKHSFSYLYNLVDLLASVVDKHEV